MENILEKYKKWLAVNGQSHNTIENYLYRLGKFINTLDNEDNITQEVVDNYLLYLRENNSISTVNGYIATLKSFFTFLKKDNIELPKSLKPIEKIREYMTKEFFEDEFLPIVENVFRKDSRRMIALFSFLFYTGLRKREFSRLKREHFDLDQLRVKILNNKSKKEKILVYPEKVKTLLEMYFENSIEKTNAFNMTANNLRNKCDKLKPHFEKINIHPHLFRHSFASHMVNNGLSMPKVQNMLGHSSILTTQIYSHTTIEDIEKEYHEKIG